MDILFGPTSRVCSLPLFLLICYMISMWNRLIEENNPAWRREFQLKPGQALRKWNHYSHELANAYTLTTLRF